jgi:hypothetical protein
MWQEIDPDDLKSSLTQPELDLFEQGSSATGSPDRLPRILDEVVSMIRGRVAAFAENRVGMGKDDEIPEELYGAAMEIARYRFLSSFPQGKLFNDETRTQLYKDALKQLDAAAKGLLFVELAGNVQFVPDANRFGSRDDALQNPALFQSPFGRCNPDLIDFGFWH